MEKEDKGNWLPLESNPDILNDYARKLGFDTTKYSFVDVFSTEDWAIKMCPKPNLALMFLFLLPPSHKNLKAYRQHVLYRFRKCRVRA